MLYQVADVNMLPLQFPLFFGDGRVLHLLDQQILDVDFREGRLFLNLRVTVITFPRAL